MREKGLGKIQEGFYGDYILIDGNPLEEISVLQGRDSNSHIGPNFPELKDMQKKY